MNPNAVVLQAQQLSKRFEEGRIALDVLQGIDLCVPAGEVLAIVGVSGSGKSTLLHLLGGLDLASSGKVEMMGRDFARMSAREQGQWRNQHMGFVYQFHHLLPEFSALENVAMPLLIRRSPKAQALAAAAEMLRKVAIARALVTKPACVLADEPTGNLDRSNANGVFDLMLGLAREHGTALVLVTHDTELAARCDRVLHLQLGQFVEAQRA